MKQRFFKYDTHEDYSSSVRPIPSVSLIKENGSVLYDILQAVNRSINAPLMDACVSKGWAKESTDYLTFEEAADVTSLNFNGNTNIKSLEELVSFTGINSLSIGTFNNMTNLEKIVLPPFNGWTQPVPSNVFPGCTNLDTVDARNANFNVTCSQMFNGNSKLRHVYFGEKVSSIIGSTIYQTPNIRAIQLHYKGVVTVASPQGETNTTRFYVPDEYLDDYKTDASHFKSSGWSSIASRIFPLSQWDTDFPKNPVQMAIADDVTANILNTVLDARISKDGVFTEQDAKMTYNGMLSGMKSIRSFPEFNKFTNVTDIGTSFSNSSTVTYLKMPNSLTTSGQLGNSGSDLTNLKKVVYGSNISALSSYAFSRLRGLTYIVIKTTTPPTVGTQAFWRTTVSNIYVPDASVDSYKSVWSAVASSIKSLSQFATDFPNDDISLEGE